jgi:hypothetical protein
MLEDHKQSKPDWLPVLIGTLVAMSTTLIAVIILFFFHGM